jgi:hypothetical protein
VAAEDEAVKSLKEQQDEPCEASVGEYKRLHARWMDDRVDRYGALPDDEETAWAEKLDGVWQKLSGEDQETVNQWVIKQQDYRRAHDIPMVGEGFDLTPEERARLTFEGEYELIVAESDERVVFQINGREVVISTGVLLDYDDEGRYWIARYDAEEMGLLQ